MPAEGVCRGCQQPILWITMTATGKATPADPGPIIEYLTDAPSASPYTPKRIMLVTEAGTTAGGWKATPGDPGAVMVKGYVSHFSTCPQAEQFRRGRA